MPQANGLGECRGDAAGDVCRILAAADLREDQHELVAAKARDRLLSTCFRQATDLPFGEDRVASTDTADEPLCDFLEQKVAHVVAECIVYALKLVEIDEQHGKTALMTLRGRQGAPEERASAPDWGARSDRRSTRAYGLSLRPFAVR